MNEMEENAMKWYCSNFLNFNRNKNHKLTFSTTKRNNNNNHTVKLLGFILVSSLNYQLHISELIIKFLDIYSFNETLYA